MIDWSEILESRLVQAIVAGLVVAVGWLVNGWQNRRAATRLRAEKLRDYHRAIYAEIAGHLFNLSSIEELTAYRDTFVERMQSQPDWVPLIPRERNDRIFQALIPEINILPRVTIDPIVLYYNQLAAIDTLVDDMRGERFLSLEQDRRIAMYEDYMGLKIQAFYDGHYAIRMISAFADGGREGALSEEKRIARELSSQDGALSGQSPGSG